jgi:hypothetical protein
MDTPKDPTAQAASNTASSSPQPGASTSKCERRTGTVWEIYSPWALEGHRDAVFLSTFPPFVFLWPSLVALWLCAFLQGIVGVDPTVVGWIAVCIIGFNLIVFVQDFDQKQFAIMVLLLLAGLLLVWVVNLYGFTFIKSIVQWALGFQPQMSTDAYVILGLVFFVLFAWAVITPLFSYWRFEQNEFVHFSQPAGRDMSIARAGCTVYKEIPDVFECILGFGAGTLVVKKENQVLATIPHVPFLGWRMDAIEHLLSETRVIVEREV